MAGALRRYGLLRGQGLDLGPCSMRYAAAERTMLRLLADRAAERPDHDWLVFDGTAHLTYGAAWREICRVGHALDRDLGAGAQHVALLLRNQTEFIAALHGPQVRGGVAVPLNAESRGPLLQGVIEHSDAEALLVRADLLDRLAELDGLGGVRLVVVAGDDAPVPDELHSARVVRWSAWLDGCGDEHAWPFPAHDAPCLIQYTSGTTAQQKGAVFTHHFQFLFSAGATEAQRRTEADVLTTPMPIYHVAALQVIVHSAAHAGCVAHLKSRFSASQFWQECADDGATWALLIAAMATMIAKTTPDPVPEHRMTTLFCTPPPTELDEFERRFAPVQVTWWGYGMTEIYPLPAVTPAEIDRSLPLDTIGMPVRYMDYGVVDEHDQLLPPGEVGELVFRPQLPHAMTSGYYKDPERTVERFRNLLFHTGDLGRLDEQGLLHFASRTTERIRRRGENIGAPEVESVALRHEAVVEAAAYAVPSELGDDEVKLDVVLKLPVEAATLHEWLAGNLPRYMVPRYLEIRPEFPKTPSLRVEKYKLQAQPLDRPEVWEAAGSV